MTLGALILAGGRATRMGGIAKHEIVVDGETIFARQVRVLRAFTDDIIVSAPVDLAGFRTVRDARDGIGPLGGIAAGLAAARTEWLVVIAGDMPHPSAAVIALMRELAAPEVDAVGIRKAGWPEPLFCLLRVAPARVAIDRLFAAECFKASALLDSLRVAWLAEDRARAADPELRTLHNVNEPRDL
jgi:molybdenum cofactor guanylyltransferase